MIRLMLFISKRVTFSTLLLMLFFSVITTDSARADELISIAKKSLSRFLELIPENNLKGYGFDDPSELKRAELGVPYQIHTFKKEFLNGEISKTDDALVFTKEFRFPVVVDGKYKALLTLSDTGSGWKGVNFGAAALARELKGVEESRKVRSDDVKIMVRYYQKQCDFLIFSDSSKSVSLKTLYPLASGKRFLSEFPGNDQESITMDLLKGMIRQSNAGTIPQSAEPLN